MRSTAKIIRLVGAAIACAMGASTSTAQSVPIRALAPSDAKSAQQFGSILGIRQIAGGKVLVNDATRRQLTVLDAKLANGIVVIDSVSEGGQSYGPRATPIIPYLGDSTLFVDAVSRALVLIDPSGKIVRTISAPKPADIRLLGRSASGVDAKGNLVYRTDIPEPPPGAAKTDSNKMPNDMAPIVRANFETRMIDTIDAVKMNPPSPLENAATADGKPAFRVRLHPLPTIDEWAVLSDGSLAVVRGHDYHVDFIRPDGKRESAAKLPYDFKRLTDDDKQKLTDSVRAAEQKRQATAPQGGVNPRAVSSTGVGAPLPQRSAPIMLYDVVSFKEIPDYYPPIRIGATKADADGNLWILPTTSAQSVNGELVYDVVNNRGAMIERVRVPAGRSIAGFGRGGVVYLMSKDSANQWTLERTRVTTAPAK